MHAPYAFTSPWHHAPTFGQSTLSFRLFYIFIYEIMNVLMEWAECGRGSGIFFMYTFLFDQNHSNALLMFMCQFLAFYPEIGYEILQKIYFPNHTKSNMSFLWTKYNFISFSSLLFFFIWLYNYDRSTRNMCFVINHKQLLVVTQIPSTIFEMLELVNWSMCHLIVIVLRMTFESCRRLLCQSHMHSSLTATTATANRSRSRKIMLKP